MRLKRVYLAYVTTAAWEIQIQALELCSLIAKWERLVKARIYNVTFSCLSCLSGIIMELGGDEGLLGVLAAGKCCLIAVGDLGCGAVQRKFNFSMLRGRV